MFSLKSLHFFDPFRTLHIRGDLSGLPYVGMIGWQLNTGGLGILHLNTTNVMVIQTLLNDIVVIFWLHEVDNSFRTQLLPIEKRLRCLVWPLRDNLSVLFTRVSLTLGSLYVRRYITTPSTSFNVPITPLTPDGLRPSLENSSVSTVICVFRGWRLDDTW